MEVGTGPVAPVAVAITTRGEARSCADMTPSLLADAAPATDAGLASSLVAGRSRERPWSGWESDVGTSPFIVYAQKRMG